MEAAQLHFEEEIARNPYSLKLWWSYIEYKLQQQEDGRCSKLETYIVYERALKNLPRSYKIWRSYLDERSRAVRNKCITDKKIKILVNTFERAIVHMNKMPRIWTMYLELLVKSRKGTFARKTFDRALQALPITQHKDLWDLYISWATEYGVGETAIRVYRRFLMYDPSSRETFVSFLEESGQFEEAALQLSICLNDDTYVSPSGKTQHQMWMHLCDLCSAHPQDVSNTINVEAIVRSGIARFSDEVGRLWNSLADYYIRLGQFEKARDIYEEGINSVTTVRDFTIIFDAYVKVEESILTTKISFMQDQEDEEAMEAAGDEAKETKADIDMRLARIEYLIDKRPIMLNSVVLRQNPHNVNEWHKRAKLYSGDVSKTILTYVEAVQTIDPKLASGKLSGLWMALARFYENNEDVANARSCLDQATTVIYKTVDELANVWCAWGEMEMRVEEYEKAFAVMKQAVTEPSMSHQRRKAHAMAQGLGAQGDSFLGSTCQDRVHKSVKVWSLYLDLEESLGTTESCRAAYDRCMELKVITAQMSLNYATFLEERDFFEDSFRVYERSVSLFHFPQVKVIWVTYLDKFMVRYEGAKIERLRDLFEQSIANVPPADAVEFYLKYAKAEEQHGLARHAMTIYDKATRVVPEPERLNMYRLYVKKVEQFFGVTRTRPVYERAIKELVDLDSKAMCLEFSDMERKIGEIDRARAIMQFGSQFADPRKDPRYWRVWREFEEAHGNEDTFRDMLRVQRSVETSYSQVNYLASEMMAGSFQPETKEPNSLEEMENNAELAAAAANSVEPGGDRDTEAGGGESVPVLGGKRKLEQAATIINEDEIDI